MNEIPTDIDYLKKYAAELDHHLEYSGENDDETGESCYYVRCNETGNTVHLQFDDGEPYSAFTADDICIALDWVAEQKGYDNESR